MPEWLNEKVKSNWQSGAEGAQVGGRESGCLGAYSLLGLIRTHRADVMHLAHKNKISDVMVFGSCARGEEHAQSDIDFLVTFEDGASLLNQVHMRDDLQALFGMPVDVVSRRGLSPYIGTRILAEAVPV